MKKIQESRLPELDALRGLAALSVIYYHYTYIFRPKLNYNFSPRLDFSFGHFGVELFFMISGFVILMSLKRIKTVKEFIYKRFLRLYPTYWFCLSVTLLMVSFQNVCDFSFTVRDKFLNYLMFQGVFKATNIDGSYWTLFPELCFYALIIILWKFKMLERLMSVSIVWLCLMPLALIRPTAILKFGMFFLMGMMFYKLKQNFKSRYPHIIIIFSLIAVLLLHEDFKVFAVSIFFVSIFYLLIFGKLKILNKPTLVFFGKISYPLYLIHQTVGLIIISYFVKNGVNHYLAILFTIGIVIVIAWIIYEYFEKPILRKFK